MKRIPFTLEAWKAGGVPVTRSGEYVKQLTWFENVKENYILFGSLKSGVECWDIKGDYFTESSEESDKDIMLEVPCTKYYTHYYRVAGLSEVASYTNKNEKATLPVHYGEFIKTVEVEL